MTTATEWIATDQKSVMDDIARLGIEGAANYQMDLIRDRQSCGDHRWDGITAAEMREALEDVANA